ncbi:MAG: hypothetical protein F6K19_48795, partial [Cyanothece sp. SIO1E1]|nr:hypothetical protein [Cyanothece sp. SIO1E1]
MPMNRKLYPDDWEAIALSIKQQANWQCQACGRPCRQLGESVGEFIDRLNDEFPTWPTDDLYESQETEEFGLVEVLKPGRYVLTVAHLDHQPANCDPDNLRAWCSVCHLRYDAKAISTK